MVLGILKVFAALFIPIYLFFKASSASFIDSSFQFARFPFDFLEARVGITLLLGLNFVTNQYQIVV